MSGGALLLLHLRSLVVDSPLLLVYSKQILFEEDPPTGCHGRRSHEEWPLDGPRRLNEMSMSIIVGWADDALAFV